MRDSLGPQQARPHQQAILKTCVSWCVPCCVPCCVCPDYILLFPMLCVPCCEYLCIPCCAYHAVHVMLCVPCCDDAVRTMLCMLCCANYAVLTMLRIPCCAYHAVRAMLCTPQECTRPTLPALAVTTSVPPSWVLLVSASISSAVRLTWGVAWQADTHRHTRYFKSTALMY
jgi:hypothetical protein